MKRMLAVCLLTSFASVVSAQTAVGANVGVSDRADTIEAAKTRPFCVQETGTRVRSARPSHATGERATDCALSRPGRSYTRGDIQRTGEANLADALRKLDPSIH